MIVSLCITVYLGENFSLVRGLVLAVLSGVACYIVTTIYRKFIGSRYLIFNIVGTLVFIGFTGLCLYVILVSIASVDSVS
jgi:hypothetical protein